MTPITITTVRGFTSTVRSSALADRNDVFGLEEKEWQFDDISSAGHDELEQHREAREYARIAAYEMPLLHRRFLPFSTRYFFFIVAQLLIFSSGGGEGDLAARLRTTVRTSNKFTDTAVSVHDLYG